MTPALREPESEEPCPPRGILESYARGGRDPQVAGHVSRCDRCAWIVSTIMEATPLAPDGEVIDITPHVGWWRRFLSRFSP